MFKYSWHVGFAIVFLIAFVAMLALAYASEARKRKVHYKGAWKAVASIAGVSVVVYALIRVLMATIPAN